LASKDLVTLHPWFFPFWILNTQGYSATTAPGCLRQSTEGSALGVQINLFHCYPSLITLTTVWQPTWDVNSVVSTFCLPLICQPTQSGFSSHWSTESAFTKCTQELHLVKSRTHVPACSSLTPWQSKPLFFLWERSLLFALYFDNCLVLFFSPTLWKPILSFCIITLLYPWRYWPSSGLALSLSTISPQTCLVKARHSFHFIF
jgi:hypothetical protein